jgi:subtilisin family serine protease
VVAAAGNSGNDQQRVYPAAEQVKGSLAVTSFNAQRRLSRFANWGSWISLAAPGERIISAVPGGGYGVWSGTSMATPWVSGTAALVLSTLPAGGDMARSAPRQWSPESVTKRLTDRGAKLCATSFLGVDAVGALTDIQPLDPVCP